MTQKQIWAHEKNTLCLDRKIQQHKDTTSENKIKETNQNTTLYIEISVIVYIFQDHQTYI